MSTIINATGKLFFPSLQFGMAMRDGRVLYIRSKLNKNYRLEQLDRAIQLIEQASTDVTLHGSDNLARRNRGFATLQGMLQWDPEFNTWVTVDEATRKSISLEVKDKNGQVDPGYTRKFDNSIYDSQVTKTKSAGVSSTSGEMIYAARLKKDVNPFIDMQNIISANQLLRRYGVAIDTEGNSDALAASVASKLNKFGTSVNELK